MFFYKRLCHLFEFTKALHRLKIELTLILYNLVKGGGIMSINDKVIFSGKIYRIIYDYRNGQYEIMKDDLLRQVELVTEDQITRVH